MLYSHETGTCPPCSEFEYSLMVPFYRSILVPICNNGYQYIVFLIEILSQIGNAVAHRETQGLVPVSLKHNETQGLVPVSLNQEENMTVAGTAKLLLFTNEQGKTNNNCC